MARLRTAAPARTLGFDLHIPKVVSMKNLAGRGVLIAGRRTLVRLGSAMREALEDIAQQTGSSVSVLATEIDRERKQQKLDTAVRDYVVAYYRASVQTALHGDVGKRCAIISVGKPEQGSTKPSSGTSKLIPTRWRGQPLHG